MTTEGKKRALRWPAAIVTVFVLHAAGMVTVMVIASRDPSFAVEPNHYQKAVAWDAFSQRRRASRALGWNVTAKSEPGLDARGTRSLELFIADEQGKPVLGARAAVLAFSHARGQERLRVDLVEGESGHYAARAPMARTGIWELRLVAEREGDVFTTTFLHVVGGAP